MIWQQPWAWVGLLTLAVPILIHLLGRGPARTQRFPTLRFLERSRMLPTRRTRLHDMALLLVRVATLALAVAALAQPRWLTAARQRAFIASMARLVIVDTSASVVRAVGGPSAFRDSVDRTVAALATTANGGVRIRIETASPATAIDGAVSWLAGQSERREIAIVSDFQRTALSARDLARIPADVGIRLVRIGRAHTGPARDTAARDTAARDTLAADSALLVRAVGDVTVRAVARANGTDRARTQVKWSERPLGEARGDSRVALLSGERDRTRMLEAIDIAREVVPATSSDGDSGAGVGLSAQQIVVIAADAPNRAALQTNLSLPREAWMLQLIAALREHAMVQHSAGAIAGAAVDVERGLPIAYFSNGVPAILAAQDSRRGASRLAFLLHREVPPVLVTALAAAIAGYDGATNELAEREPSRLSDRELAQWQRAAAATPGRTDNAPTGPRVSATQGRSVFADAMTADSDGRWLWMGVVLLLVVETVLRRSTVRA